MNRNGFSLVELVVIIAIIGILLSIGTLNFHDWQVKYNIERQVKEMAADFDNLRLMAIHQKRRLQATITANSYTFADTAGNTISVRNVTYPIQTTGGPIIFNERGFAEGITERGIWVTSAGGAAIDSLIVSTAKNNMGKRQGNGTFTKK